MDKEKPNKIVEKYKQRISDLIDEAEDAIGYPINTCEIERPMYHVEDGKYHRNVKFNIEL